MSSQIFGRNRNAVTCPVEAQAQEVALGVVYRRAGMKITSIVEQDDRAGGQVD